MATNTKTYPEVKKQVNTLCNKMKMRYPNLYQETGGKLVRKTLLGLLLEEVLEQNPVSEVKVMRSGIPSESSSLNGFNRSKSRVLKHSTSTKAA